MKQWLANIKHTIPFIPITQLEIASLSTLFHTKTLI